MARYAYDNLRLRIGVVLAKEETYAKGIQKVFADEFQRKGGRIVETVEFPANTSDFAALADRAATLKPDFVYVAAYADDISQMIRDLRELTVHRHDPHHLLVRRRRDDRQDRRRRRGRRTSPRARSTSPRATGRRRSSRSSRRTAPSTRPIPTSTPRTATTPYAILVEAYRQGGTESASRVLEGDARRARVRRASPASLQFDEKGDVRSSRTSTSSRDGTAVDIEQERQEQIEKARQKMKRIQDELDGCARAD